MLGWNEFALLVHFTTLSHAFFNFEELTNTKYALDIINSPLNELEIGSEKGVKLASRHGQRYHCTFPAVAEDSLKKEETVSISTPVSLLLEPMKQEECLTVLKGWWTYEFCYGKYVKQYHQEGDTLKAITYLGYYESDFDWNKESKEDSATFRQHKLSRYHSQRYVNGTACDVIEHNRDSEIRFKCDDSSTETYIERVDEPSTCSYILTIHTPYICSHPRTLPLHERTPLSITCQPLLSFEDYTKFEETEAGETAMELPKLSTDVRKQLLQPAVRNIFDLLQLAKQKSNIDHENSPEASSLEVRARIMIERFISLEIRQTLEAPQQKRLEMEVLNLLEMYSHLPTADQARIVERHVSNFVGGVGPLPDSEDVVEKSPNRVTIRVKVHKMKSGRKLDDIKSEGESLVEDHPANNDPAMEKLENDIGKELRDAGLEAEEGVIEIRLITDSEDLELDSGSEDGLRQMLFELVAGGFAAKNEVKKQKTLHNNYNMVWQKDSSTFKSVSSFDEDGDTEAKSPKV